MTPDMSWSSTVREVAGTYGCRGHGPSTWWPDELALSTLYGRLRQAAFGNEDFSASATQLPAPTDQSDGAAT
jgi:hypothetical protein